MNEQFSLRQQLKILRNVLPTTQKQPEVISKLPIFKQLKKSKITRVGIFQKLSFCFPLIDPVYDLIDAKATDLIRGVFNQGGDIIEYHRKMHEKFAKYVLIDRRYDLFNLRKKLKHRVEYELIVDYKFIQDSLKKFKRVDVLPYVIEAYHLHHYDNIPSDSSDSEQQDIVNKKYINNSREQIRMVVKKKVEVKEDSRVVDDDQMEKGREQKQNGVDQRMSDKVMISQRQGESPRRQINQEKQEKQKPRCGQRLKRSQLSLGSFSFSTNDFICKQLMRLNELHLIENNSGNFAYIRAVSCIKNYHKQIRTVQDIAQISDISSHMRQKIKQILLTGSIQKLQRSQQIQNVIAIKQLMNIWGIGVAKAKQLYLKGVKSVHDLLNRQDQLKTLTKNQRIGLKYYQQFKNRIPRQKVTRIFDNFKSIFYELVENTTTHHIEVAGSYRRGRPTCGDIDIIISRIDGSVEKNLLFNLINILKKDNFITDSLTEPKQFDGKSPIAFMGVCIFQGVHHRIDIKHFPIEMYPFALLYFTGSDLFNREIRMVAHHKGLLLCQKSLRKKQRNSRDNIYKGQQIPIFKTQQDIFKFLEINYSPPHQRQI